MDPLEVLFDGTGIGSGATPDDLARLYGGTVGFQGPALYSNFVASLDGVAALEDREATGLLSAHNEADRFLIGLLRACADAVLLGAGTLRATPRHRWTPAAAFPALAESYADLRRRRGLSAEPRVVIATRTGEIDVSHPAVQAGALFLTTTEGRDRLAGNLPANCDLWVAGATEVELPMAVDRLQREGMPIVLTEGGPHIMGALLREDRIDEMFLTLAPLAAGREGSGRLAMVEGAQLLPGHAAGARLSGVRRHGDFLFLRYQLNRPRAGADQIPTSEDS